MSKAHLVKKQIKVSSLSKIIKYQVIYQSFIMDVKLTEAQIDLITFLYSLINNDYTNGISISEFCRISSEVGIYNSNQSVRNAINKIRKTTDFLEINSGGDKNLNVNKKLQIKGSGNIVLDFKMIFINELQ